jgi:hypothetical protein
MLISTIDLYGKCVGLKIHLAVFDVTTLRRGYLAQQLACSTAEGRGLHEVLHGKSQVVVLDLKKIGMSGRITANIKNTLLVFVIKI